MTANDDNPEVARLMKLMTGPEPDHHRFSGQPLDPAQIDAPALGDLLTIAHATDRGDQGFPSKTVAAQTAWAVLALGRKMEPAFRGPACRDYLDHLARRAEEKRAEGKTAEVSDIGERFLWQDACFALARCIDLSFDGLGAAARRFLAATNWQIMPQLAIALARLVDAEFATRALEKLAIDLAASPLLVDELRVVASLELGENIAIADAAYPDSLSEAGEPLHRLADHPGYVAFAEAGLKQAAERVRQIHDRTLPYAADKAFTLKESGVIGRLARVALERDESWLPAVLDELFCKVSMAPTAAKTVPSQSVAITLGHAVEAFPTPESVATLRGVLRAVRHAGVKKKLERNVRGAERGLADRPEIALRLPADQPVSKSQLTTLTRCLEASLALRTALTCEDWRARLAENPQVSALTTSLVWRILRSDASGTAVLPAIGRGGVTLEDVGGTTVAVAPGCHMMLWHPTDATEVERTAWRDRLARCASRSPSSRFIASTTQLNPESCLNRSAPCLPVTLFRSCPFSVWPGGNAGSSTMIA